MARPLAQIEQEIRELSTSDKETLLRTLWEELDGVPDPNVDEAWLEEARRRDKELDEGHVESTAADDVFKRLEARLKK
jgi:putative addiction module component (TIGR02574 family)